MEEEEKMANIRLAGVIARASAMARTHRNPDSDVKKIFGWDLNVLRFDYEAIAIVAEETSWRNTMCTVHANRLPANVDSPSEKLVH